ncbi:MAG: TetR/AcrR family transcriptional regulator [Candidatus Hermodarchaeota archaeon]
MSENSSKKQTRSRSPEKKAAQFEQILEEGKELFLEKGRDGFSLRGLAKILGMNQNNLYNYVDSKRELWIAIRNKFYSQYRNENIEIMKEHQGTITELLMKFAANFLEFAHKDFKAFSMMHLTESPPSDKVGKFEKEYEEFNFLKGTARIVQNAIKAKEIKYTDSGLITFFLYSLILGAAIVERNMRMIEQNPDFEGDKISEIFSFRSDFNSLEFRNFALEKLEIILKDSELIQKK